MQCSFEQASVFPGVKYAGVRHIVPWASPVGAGARSASWTSALFVAVAVVPAQVSACSFRISWRHILPNVEAPLIVQRSLHLFYAILAEPSLSFRGWGRSHRCPPGGMMLSKGRGLMCHSAWVSISPGVAITAVAFGFNGCGDALRDALDPRLIGT